MRKSITAEERLAVTLRFLATGSTYLIGKKSVGKKFRLQKFSSVKNIRHVDKNSSLFIDGFFTDKVF